MGIVLAKSVNYPESDGKPMGETDWHIDAIIRIRELLKRYFLDEVAYVGSDMLFYYEQGIPKKFVVPDVFVVKGLKQRQRRIYRLWIERKVPNVVFEVTSKKTRKKDAVTKPDLYAELGVPEYFLYDPDCGYLDPPLQGYRLVGDRYERILAETDGSLISDELALRVFAELEQLQLARLDTGERLKTGAELADEARDAEYEARRLAEKETLLRQEAETLARNAQAEVERLKAELARLTGRDAAQ